MLGWVLYFHFGIRVWDISIIALEEHPLMNRLFWSFALFRSPLSSTIRVRDGLDGSRRYSLMMQIVYTKPHKIYYLSRVRVRGDYDRLIDKGRRTR